MGADERRKVLIRRVEDLADQLDDGQITDQDFAEYTAEAADAYAADLIAEAETVEVGG